MTPDLLSLDVDGTCVKTAAESTVLAGTTCVDIIVGVMVDLLPIAESVCVDEAAESAVDASFLPIADSVCVDEAAESAVDACFLPIADSVCVDKAAESVTDAFFLPVADSVCVDEAAESVIDASFLPIADSVCVDKAAESATNCSFLLDDTGGFVAAESKVLLSAVDATGVAKVTTVSTFAATVTVEGSKLITRPIETPSATTAVDL